MTSRRFIFKLLSLLFVFALYSCGQQEGSTANTESTDSAPKSEAPVTVSGSYANADYNKRAEGYDWVGVTISSLSDEKIQFSVRSRADKKQPTCTLDGIATKTRENTYEMMLRDKSLLLKFSKEGLELAASNPADEGGFAFYCSGGANVVGKYSRIDGALDPAQVDKTQFSTVLMLQGIGFNVSSKPSNGKNEVTVQPFGLESVNDAVKHEIDGKVVNAEVQDMNGDGSPELLIYTQSGANKKGDVIAYSVNNKKSMSQVAFPALTEKEAAGYNGHDEFSIVENALGRRFPINQGKAMRQMSYKLVDGEAMRQLQVATVNDIEVNK